MKLSFVLLDKKFDYTAIIIAIISLSLIICNLFYTTGFSSETLWMQLLMIVLYFFGTRGRVERNLKEHGIEPIIFLSIFIFMNILIILSNIIEFLKSL